MKIYIGSDHAGVALKSKVLAKVQSMGCDVEDLGPYSEDRVDYPVYGRKVGERVAADPESRGIVICGSGIGISIAANKVPGIRAALCGDPLSAKLCREHNNANILAMGARIIGEALAMEIVENFLTTEFAGGRHQHRVDKLTSMDKERW